MSINLMTQSWALEAKKDVHYFNEVTSTSDWAKNNFNPQSHKFSLYLTDHQTQGRGRGQNQWFDQGQGHTLLSTWCFKMNYTPQPIMTALIGLCVYESLQSVFKDLKFRIKPPNDIFLLDQKLCGLLVEVIEQGDQHSIFIGLGMNVFDSPKTDQPTTALQHHTDVTPEKWTLFCQSLFKEFSQTIDQNQKNQLSINEQNRLLIALNNGLNEDKKYLSISAQGDLYTKHQMIPWFNL